jgi:hypothetical protein
VDDVVDRTVDAHHVEVDLHGHMDDNNALLVCTTAQVTALCDPGHDLSVVHLSAGHELQNKGENHTAPDQKIHGAVEDILPG